MGHLITVMKRLDLAKKAMIKTNKKNKTMTKTNTKTKTNTVRKYLQRETLETCDL